MISDTAVVLMRQQVEYEQSSVSGMPTLIDFPTLLPVGMSLYAWARSKPVFANLFVICLFISINRFCSIVDQNCMQ